MNTKDDTNVWVGTYVGRTKAWAMEPKSTHKPPRAATMVAAAAAGRLRDGMIAREVEDDLWTGWMHVMEALSVLRQERFDRRTGRPARTNRGSNCGEAFAEASSVRFRRLLGVGHASIFEDCTPLPAQAREEASGRSKQCRFRHAQEVGGVSSHCSRTEAGDLRHRSVDRSTDRYPRREVAPFAVSDLHALHPD